MCQSQNGTIRIHSFELNEDCSQSYGKGCLLAMRDSFMHMGAAGDKESGGKNQGGSGHSGGTRQKGGQGERGESGSRSEGSGSGNKSEGSGKKSGTPGGERHH